MSNSQELDPAIQAFLNNLPLEIRGYLLDNWPEVEVLNQELKNPKKFYQETVNQYMKDRIKLKIDTFMFDLHKTPKGWSYINPRRV